MIQTQNTWFFGNTTIPNKPTSSGKKKPESFIKKITGQLPSVALTAITSAVALSIISFGFNKKNYIPPIYTACLLTLLVTNYADYSDENAKLRAFLATMDERLAETEKKLTDTEEKLARAEQELDTIRKQLDEEDAAERALRELVGYETDAESSIQ